MVNSQDRLSYYLGRAETLRYQMFLKWRICHSLRWHGEFSLSSIQSIFHPDKYLILKIHIYVPILGSFLIIWHIGSFCKTFFFFKYLLISTLNHIHTKKTQAHNLNIRKSFWRVDQDEDNTLSEKSEARFQWTHWQTGSTALTPGWLQKGHQPSWEILGLLLTVCKASPTPEMAACLLGPTLVAGFHWQWDLLRHSPNRQEKLRENLCAWWMGSGRRTRERAAWSSQLTRRLLPMWCNWAVST